MSAYSTEHQRGEDYKCKLSNVVLTHSQIELRLPDMRLVSIATLFALSATSARAGYLKNYHVVQERQLLESYDYVIIGAGTAGNVLANRLSEIENGTSDPDYTCIRYSRSNRIP